MPPILGPSYFRYTQSGSLGLASFGSGHSEIIALRAIDRRSQIGLRHYQTGPPFDYDLARLLYTRKRRLEIKR